MDERPHQVATGLVLGGPAIGGLRIEESVVVAGLAALPRAAGLLQGLPRASGSQIEPISFASLGQLPADDAVEVEEVDDGVVLETLAQDPVPDRNALEGRNIGAGTNGGEG